MDEEGQKSQFLTALTTEHMVLQSSIGATLSEIQSRSSMFIGVLTGALVAMGFAVQSEAAFFPFVATVLPAVFVMGVLTVLRLTDILVENANAEIGVARVRREYRRLGAAANAFFDPKFGRWPESPGNPALRLGSFVAYWTSSASMIAVMNTLVGATAVTLILQLAAGIGFIVALLAGLAFAVLTLAAYFHYQKVRIGEVDRFARDEAGIATG